MTSQAERSAAWRDRNRAAGYRLLHGRFTTEPRVNRQANEPPAHGTARRYNSYTFRCRCPECTAAVLAYNNAWKAANPELVREQQRRTQVKRRASLTGGAA